MGGARNEEMNIIGFKCKRDEEKGVAVSYEFSIGCTFLCCRPARRFLLPPLPASAAALCPYMAAARSQSAPSQRPIQTESVRDEKGGNRKQEWAPQPNNAAPQRRLPNLPAGLDPRFNGGERS